MKQIKKCTNLEFKSKIYIPIYSSKFEEVDVIKTTFLRCVFIHRKKCLPRLKIHLKTKEVKKRRLFTFHE